MADYADIFGIGKSPVKNDSEGESVDVAPDAFTVFGVVVKEKDKKE
jgi:hypothetical protein